MSSEIDELTVNYEDGGELVSRELDKVILTFQKIVDFSINNRKKFVGYGDFFIPNSAKLHNRIYVGEATGFQDCYFGFGMKYAFLSGYLAAKSIIEEKDYDKLWKECFLAQMKSSLVSRFLFERLGNKGYEKFLLILV